MAEDTNVPRSQEDYITQDSEEIEGSVTRKLSKEFNKTESCILGALSRLGEFLLNPLIQGHYGSAPQTSRNTYGADQGTNEDHSQNYIHPEARVSQNQSKQDSDPDNQYDNRLAWTQLANTGLKNAPIWEEDFAYILKIWHKITRNRMPEISKSY